MIWPCRVQGLHGLPRHRKPGASEVAHGSEDPTTAVMMPSCDGSPSGR